MTALAATARLGVLLGWSLLLFAAAARADEPARLVDVVVETSDQGALVTITLSQPRTPRRLAAEEPPRLVFDFAQTTLPGGTRQVEVGHPLLRGVRVGQVSEDPAVARVVLDLPTASQATARAGADQRTWTVALGDVTGLGPARRPSDQVMLKSAAWTSQSAQAAVLQLTTDRAAKPRPSYREDPERLVVEFDGSVGDAKVPAPAAGNGIVRAVQLGQSGPGQVRLIVYLKAPAGYLLRVLSNPSRLELRIARGQTKGRLVVLDAGHGGHDSGTPGCLEGLFEKRVNLDVVLRAAALLRGKGVRVELTRDDDTFVPLSERAALANRLRADLFVSVHCNALAPDLAGQHTGTELYYYTDQSAPFAQTMLKEFCAVAKLPSRGVYQRRFVVVRETAMPSVLVECGYLDHERDGALLDTPEFRAKCALGITHGVIRYLQRLPKGLAAAEEAS